LFDSTFEEILREKPRSRKELLDLNKQAKSPLSKIPYKTLYRRLKQLQTYGVIKHVPDIYKLVEHVEEANHDEVEDCLKVIRNRDENEEVIYGRIKRLRVLSGKKRLANIPSVLSTFHDALENPKITGTERNFEELTLTLKNILNHERKYKLLESEQIIKEISGNILKKIIRIIKQKTEFQGDSTIGFLAESEKIEAVETLFYLVIRFKHDLDHRQIEKLAHAFVNLYPHHLTINKHIEDLIRSDNEELKQIAKRLREIILWQASL